MDQDMTLNRFALHADQIAAAEERIRPYIRRTPLLQADDILPDSNAHIHLKLELFQHSGSFKARGAFNSILANSVPEAGVVAASGGNHGFAVAFAANQLGIPAHIFVPDISSPAKQRKIREAGGILHVGGQLYADALKRSQDHAAASGAHTIHAYDDVMTLAGQATLGREWLEQIATENARIGADNPVDTVLIAVGGGGLIGGVTASFLNDAPEGPKIVAVEPEGSACLWAALQADEIVDVAVESIAADSLGAKSVGAKSFDICRTARDAGRFDAVLVPDDAIRKAQRLLWDRFQIISEPGGATALAALLSAAYDPKPGERIGVLVCGANTDFEAFA